MGILKKEIFAQNLQDYRVLIEDRVADSEYFVITQLSTELSAGRNSFLIQGTDFLKNSTELKLELTDSQGEPVYIQPIKNYLEGRSRLVTMEVYDSTASGPATLTVMAEAAYFSNGTPIPEEWRSKYNLRWSRRVVINPLIDNTTKIRLETNPLLTVSEVFFPVVPAQAATISATYTGSISGRPLLQNSNLYQIEMASPFISSSMEKGTITILVTI